MNWFHGSIAEAVSLSKAKNAIFVVYVEGNDELSQKLRGFINENKIKDKLESERFVAVRIESGSEAYMQFAQIYQLVPLPSLFFIGKNGAPIEIATGVLASVEELEEKINRVLAVAGFKTDEKLTNTGSTATTSAAAVASANFISGEQQGTASKPSDIVCEDGVCYRKTDELKDEEKQDGCSLKEEKQKECEKDKDSTEETKSADELQQSQSSTSTIDNQSENDTAERVEHARKLLEQKRKDKEAEEARLEREKEVKRRKEGQDVQSLKKWKEEHELKELKDSIRKDKLEEQAARQRILEKIASDKAERAQKFGQYSTAPKPEEQAAATKSPPIQKPSQDNSEFSRIQFRKPDGESEMYSFKSTDNFQVVRDYVRDTLLQGTGIREFSLAMTFPRREFTADDDIQNLRELGLSPTAVLLIITRTSAGSSAVVAKSWGAVNLFNTVLWGILSPILAVYGYIKSIFTGQRRSQSDSAAVGAQKRASDSIADNQDSAKKRSLDRFTGNGIINDIPAGTSNESSNRQQQQQQAGKSLPYRRVGSSNVHRLRDQKDSDDENNTWNGNSTQQQ